MRDDEIYSQIEQQKLISIKTNWNEEENHFWFCVYYVILCEYCILLVASCWPVARYFHCAFLVFSITIIFVVLLLFFSTVLIVRIEWPVLCVYEKPRHIFTISVPEVCSLSVSRSTFEICVQICVELAVFTNNHKLRLLQHTHIHTQTETRIQIETESKRLNSIETNGV